MKEETLILEDNYTGSAEEEVMTEEVKVKYCLNCGTEVNDNFCPHCGQSTATPARLKMKNFGKSVLMSFGRLTPGFLNTARGLMLHPWDVIRDHIRGRQIPYSPPITMIIQIFLYATIIFTAFDTILGTDLSMEESLFGYNGDNPILKMMDTSIVFQTFFVGIPLCFGVYLAYYRHGAKKFNFAEYLAAFVYLFSAISLWDMVLSVLNMIPGIGFDLNNLIFLIIAYFGVVILLKAFPQKRWWHSVALMVWCSVIMLLCVICLGLIMSIPRLIAYLQG